MHKSKAFQEFPRELCTANVNSAESTALSCEVATVTGSRRHIEKNSVGPGQPRPTGSQIDRTTILSTS
jgi:hypothetical protein